MPHLDHPVARPVIIIVRTDTDWICSSCAICGQPEGGPNVFSTFLQGGVEAVCTDCTERHDPQLFDLLSDYHRDVDVSLGSLGLLNAAWERRFVSLGLHEGSPVLQVAADVR